MDSIVLLEVAGLCAVAGLGVLLAAHRWPRGALLAAFPFVLLAATKFRTRDPTATLSGSVDAQVVFEVGAFVLLGVTLLVVAVSLRAWPLRVSRWEWALIGFVGLAAASAAWSPISSFTLVRAFQATVLLGLAMLSIRALGPDTTLRALTWSVAVYVLVMALLAATVPAASGSRMVYYEEGTRFTWFGVHPILAATLAGLGAALAIAEGLFVPRERWTRIFRIPVVALVPGLVVVLALARARGPLIAFTAAVFVLVLRRYSRPWLATIALGASVAATVALLFVNTSVAVESFLRESAMSENPAVEFITRGNTIEYLSTLGGRTQLWKEVAQLVFERPIAGWGYAASREVILARVPWAGYAHNAVIQTMVDLGILGTLLVWSAVLAATFADLFRPFWTGPAGAVRGRVFAALVFTLVLSIVSESFAGAPGYELLLVLCAIFASERTALAATPTR